MPKRTADVCFSPALYEHYATLGSIVVMIDAIRASASICTALMNGAKEIVPFSDSIKALQMKSKGYLTAGERNGDKIPGFDFGNSPFDFSLKNVKDQKIAFTTTNGTRALNVANESTHKVDEIVVGSFLNITALSDFLQQKNSHVLILCSGWKGAINAEDSYFAGSLVNKLAANDGWQFNEGALMAAHFAKSSKQSLYDTVMQLSPRLRAKQTTLRKDFEYCLQEDISDIIPVLNRGRLVSHKTL